MKLQLKNTFCPGCRYEQFIFFLQIIQTFFIVYILCVTAGGGTAYEFYEDMSRRMQPRLFETLIFSQNRAEFISGLNFLIQ